jgi:methionyl-tRNA formyltransferase
MRIIFMGTPAFAATALAALIAAGHEVVCVYSQPPRPAGRGKQLQKSAVHQLAEQHGLEVRTPSSLKSVDEQQQFVELNADIAVVAAYGLLLPQAILDAPTHGCINIHASLLPRWRGAAPIHRAVEAGDGDTGICIMQMEAGLDTGPVLLRRAIPLSPQDTTGSLLDELAELGAALCVKALADFETLQPQPQPEDDVTYARKIDKAETRLDFAQPADVLERRVRAFNPAPGAWLELDGERLKILHSMVVPHPHDDRIEGLGDISDQLVCGEIIDHHFTICCGGNTALRPMLVQPAGRQPMTAAEFLRGHALEVGQVLS